MSKGNSIPAAILMLSCVFGPAAVAAQPIAAGDGRQTVDIAGTRLTVFTYRPANCSDPSLLLVFHGNARNARTYRATPKRSRTGTACCWSRRCSTGATFLHGATSAAAS
jgi:poly(3-hydroxybutyrate) depolymerase